jgi:thymidylate kinase
MSRLIIFEGPDSTGKTTLAKYFAKKLKAAYIHARGHRGLHRVMHKYHENLLECAEATLANGVDVVIDRHWPSERIYGRIFRPETQQLYDFTSIMDRVKALNPIYVFCTTSPDTFETHFKLHETTDHRYTHAEFSQLCDDYRALSKCMTTDGYVVCKYSIDQEGKDMDNFLKQVLA